MLIKKNQNLVIENKFKFFQEVMVIEALAPRSVLQSYNNVRLRSVGTTSPHKARGANTSFYLGTFISEPVLSHVGRSQKRFRLNSHEV